MFKILFLFILLFATLEAKLNILDVYEYKAGDVGELSALAYDGKILYSISDYGELHHFSLNLKNNKIKSIKLIKSYKLKNKFLQRLKKRKRDAEGLVYKDNNLYISFEEKPRIEKYSIYGEKIKKIKIPKILRNIDNYKSKNTALESLAYSDIYGFVTAPERPFENDNIHKLYTTKNKIFLFKASGYLTDLEFIDKYNILALERKWNPFTRHLMSFIKKVNLKDCENHICKSEVLKIIDSKKDNFEDNYEGLTKVKNNLFLMVSDDNNSPLQKTYFVLFKLSI